MSSKHLIRSGFCVVPSHIPTYLHTHAAAVVELLFTDAGGKRFAELTRNNTMKMLAILVDGNVITAPRIMEEIRGGQAHITGSFTHKEAERMAAGLTKEPWPLPEPALTFGPDIELMINDAAGGRSCFVDLDRGTVVDVPINNVAGIEELLRVSARLGIDATYDSSLRNFIGADMIALEVQREVWMMPASAFDDMPPFGTAGTPCNMSAKGDLPATFIIQTREGGRGLLQIVALVDDPKGVKIRYKLVQREGNGPSGETPVAELRAQTPPQKKAQAASPPPLDMAKAKREVATSYAAASPEIQEYILWTARQFGRSGMWLNEDAFAGMPEVEREQKVQYLVTLLEDSEYGRHLCHGLAEASALKDERLVPGLMKVAGYHREDANYDCRPKWIAVSALARQESDAAVPLLISLVDHGNQNTRKWARAALARKVGKDFKEDKQAWAKWWEAKGHVPVDKSSLRSVATEYGSLSPCGRLGISGFLGYLGIWVFRH